ncbi:MAG: ComEA family DNA-binding protein [Armatimonadota bacterium]|nr:ComEA family DNA-binding protein [Armatimonadota bacterium]
MVLVLAAAAALAAFWYSRGRGPGDGTGESGAVVYEPGAQPAPTIKVHVVGEVQRPGVYDLPAGVRVQDALRAAGGFTQQADAASVNLAAFCEDGEQIRVEAKPSPPAETAAARRSVHPQQSAAPAATLPRHSTAATGVPPVSATSSADEGSELPSFATESRQGPVRLNHAGLEELQRIPGVGPELAKRILTYRHLHGPFRSFSELDEVPGIGPGTIEQIRVSATLR